MPRPAMIVSGDVMDGKCVTAKMKIPGRRRKINLSNQRATGNSFRAAENFLNGEILKTKPRILSDEQRR